MPSGGRFDVVGIGENSVDLVYRVPAAVAPNAKLRAAARRVSFGGQAATTTAACAALGLRAAYVGTVGNDPHGANLCAALASRGVDVSRVQTRAAETRHAIILVDQRTGDRTVVWERDRDLEVRVSDLPRDLLASTRLLHVDDLDELAAIEAARIAAAAGALVTADIDRAGAGTATLIDLASVAVFSAAVPGALTGEPQPAQALRALGRRHRGWLCVTLGADGALLLEGGRLHRVPALPVSAVDTTAAGDVFRAGFIYGQLQAWPPALTLRFAAAAAAAACTREGAIDSVPSRADVERLLASVPSAQPERTAGVEP